MAPIKKKANESINSKLALVMKSGIYFGVQKHIEDTAPGENKISDCWYQDSSTNKKRSRPNITRCYQKLKSITMMVIRLNSE